MELIYQAGVLLCRLPGVIEWGGGGIEDSQMGVWEQPLLPWGTKSLLLPRESVGERRGRHGSPNGRRALTR